MGGELQARVEGLLRRGWQAPNSSPDAQYRASKLKYYLYRRALAQVFDPSAHTAKSIPHDPLLRAHALADQLRALAHRKPRIVADRRRRRRLHRAGVDRHRAHAQRLRGPPQGAHFETAFLEYGAMQNLVRASGRRIWYLNDPVKTIRTTHGTITASNWESTLTASLLKPEVWHYEIMPWPDRVFTRIHPATEEELKSYGEGRNVVPRARVVDAGAEDHRTMKGIPKAYETELQTVIAALGNMKQSDVRWQIAGTRGVGILVSDTMMFERADPKPSDQYLGSFYGLAMPLVKRGIPVEPVQIESSTAPGFLSRYRLLFLTYEGQKPPTPAFHTALAAWVRAGGALVVVDNDDDPYNAVREWWNTAPNAFATPRQHLFEAARHPRRRIGPVSRRQGRRLAERVSPAALSYEVNGGETLRGYARQAVAAIHLKWSETNALVLRRGPLYHRRRPRRFDSQRQAGHAARPLHRSL